MSKITIGDFDGEELKELLNYYYGNVFVIDGNGVLLYVNKSAAQSLGLTVEELIGSTCYEMQENGYYDKSVAMEALETKKNTISRYSTKTGLNIICCANPILDEEGNVSRVVVYSQDMAMLKDIMQEIEHEKQKNRHIQQTLSYLQEKMACQNIVSASESMDNLFKILLNIAPTDSTVMIYGESGTGKELFANAIHYASARWHRPLIKINCAAIPDELFESELFGYSEGAFTGAKKGGKKGKIFLANGGTLFLDEIGDLPLNMQAKLLRVLQEREIEVLGGEKSIPIDIRVITATNKNLLDEVKNNHFRSDLYYRINVIQIRLPALRERPEDIMVYAEKFLQEINLEYNTHVGLSARAKKVLEEYSWPGNVRELRNIIERAYTLSGGNNLITENNLPVNMLDRNRLKSRSEGQSLGFMLGEFEKEIIADTLVKNSYNIRKTAMELDISRSTLYSKMAQYSIEKKDEVLFRKDSEI